MFQFSSNLIVCGPFPSPWPTLRLQAQKGCRRSLASTMEAMTNKTPVPAAPGFAVGICGHMFINTNLLRLKNLKSISILFKDSPNLFC